MKCDHNDEIVLLASDTEVGRAAAGHVEALVKSEIGASARVVTVIGRAHSAGKAFPICSACSICSAAMRELEISSWS